MQQQRGRGAEVQEGKVTWGQDGDVGTGDKEKLCEDLSLVQIGPFLGHPNIPETCTAWVHGHHHRLCSWAALRSSPGLTAISEALLGEALEICFPEYSTESHQRQRLGLACYGPLILRSQAQGECLHLF